jgi:hypothetical protein
MRKYILLLIVTGFIAACGNHEKEKTNDNTISEKEVTDFVKLYDDLWAKRDTTGMKKAMAENYIYFTSTGNTSDRNKIISWFTPADKYKVDTAIRSEISVTINENTAVVSSRWVGSGSFDDEKFRDDQRCSLTIQKVNGELRLISEHCTQIVNQH